MTPILVALIFLTGVQRSEDANRIRLEFEAPVRFTQTAAASPPKLVIDVAGAGAGPSLIAAAARHGITVSPGAGPAGELRIALPLEAGFAASATGADSSILITLTQEPILLRASPSVAPPPPESPERSSTGGIPVPSLPLSPESPSEYVIGPEDLLEINVFELPELKTTTRVLGDGTVSLPLVGVVQAAGLTKTGFELRLRDLLESRFLLDPQVTITVTEYRSKLVAVIGAVNKPGTYQMIGPRTVLQMVSEAGGLTKEAGAEILILRQSEPGQAQRLRLDLEELVIRGNPELNLPLKPGDVVNVPVDRPVYVYVDGAVVWIKKPGAVNPTADDPVWPFNNSTGLMYSSLWGYFRDKK